MADTKLPKVKRRDFLRVGLVAGTLGSVGAFGAAALGFMWPNLGEGFGAQITVGDAGELVSDIQSERAPFYLAEGRLYVVTWDPNVPGAEDQYGEDHAVTGDGVGLMALYQKCVHLGCKVPWCQSSQWFECPCHGSKYNKWGEWMGGPAPRGLDRFPSTIEDGQFVANTGVTISGPPRTARVLQQEPEGPHCVDI